eukprot:422779-Pelagomonas_calceolata.AAC.2
MQKPAQVADLGFGTSRPECVADLGLAHVAPDNVVLSGGELDACVPVRWTAPEVLLRGECSQVRDVGVFRQFSQVQCIVWASQGQVLGVVRVVLGRGSRDSSQIHGVSAGVGGALMPVLCVWKNGVPNSRPRQWLLWAAQQGKLPASSLGLAAGFGSRDGPCTSHGQYLVRRMNA